MTYAVLPTVGRPFPVDAAGYDVGPEFVQFYWLDENGYRTPSTLLRRAEVRAVTIVR